MSDSRAHSDSGDDEPLFPDGPPSWPRSDSHIREALLHAWECGSWGQYHGDALPLLESKLSQMHAGRWVQCLSSGTIAVEVALHALGVQPGDHVVLAGYDYPGNFSAIEALGATPVLVDIDARSWSVAAAALAEAFGEYSP